MTDLFLLMWVGDPVTTSYLLAGLAAIIFGLVLLMFAVALDDEKPTVQIMSGDHEE